MTVEATMGQSHPLLYLAALLVATALPSSSGKALQPFTLIKKSAAAVSADYPDYQVGVKYDEYPVVVPKRAAVLLDRIMVALQKAVDEDSLGPRKQAQITGLIKPINGWTLRDGAGRRAAGYTGDVTSMQSLASRLFSDTLIT